jgi:hypothetical protein
MGDHAYHRRGDCPCTDRGHAVGATSQTEASEVRVTALFVPSVGLYVAALGLTIAIESPIYGLLLHVIERTPIRRGIAAGVVVNLVSHPIAFLALFPVLFRLLGVLSALIVVEIVAISVEASLLWLRGRRDPLVLLGISYLANAASLSLGLLLLR